MVEHNFDVDEIICQLLQAKDSGKQVKCIIQHPIVFWSKLELVVDSGFELTPGLLFVQVWYPFHS